MTVAIATASALGCRAALADGLGLGDHSNAITNALSEVGVDLSLLRRSARTTASIASIWVNGTNGSRTIVFSPGTMIDFPIDDRLAHAIHDAKVLHLNGRHLETAKAAVAIAKGSETLVSYDGGAHRYRKEILPLVRQADILVVAEHFARAYFVQTYPNQTVPHPDALCAVLINDFAASLVGITSGAKGSWFRTQSGDALHQPAIHVETLLDTTGCGDTFHGAFLAAHLKRLDLARSVEIAAMVSAYQAGRLGAFCPSIRTLRGLLT